MGAWMKRQTLLGFTLFLVCLARAAQAASPVTINIELTSPNTLEARYTLPPDCDEVAFTKDAKDGGTEIRQSWESIDACGKADGNTLKRTNGACTSLRFRVPASTARVRGYPAAFAFTDGVYAHGSNYAVAPTCGAVSYRLAAPQVLAAGHAWNGLAPATDDAPVGLLLTKPVPQSNGPLAYFDPKLPEETLLLIRSVAEQTVAALKRAMPDAPYSAPIIAAGLATRPGAGGYWGDASDVLRLTLYNWPAKMEANSRRELTKFVSHELSHRFQLRDAVNVYPDHRLIHEGGAELISWLVSQQQGWITPEQAADELDLALARCLLGAGDNAWRSITRRDRFAYDCGLPAYVYALAARQGNGTALQAISGFYRELGAGRQPDFAQAMECAGKAPCKATWLPDLLGADEPMEQQWAKLLTRTSLATAIAPTQVMLDEMMSEAVQKLMREDCGGGLDFGSMPAGFYLGGMKACRTLTYDVEVVTVEGHPVSGDKQALAALLSACAERAKVVLGRREGGTLELACVAPYQPRTQFYHVDVARVRQLLERR